MEIKLSIIVCSRLSDSDTMHERNVRKTIGLAEYEYIKIDNRDNRYSITAAYNEGVRRSKGNVLVFMHQDVFFVEGGWGNKLLAKFDDVNIGLIGVAGTDYLAADNPAWVSPGRPFIHGQVIHELDKGNKYHLTVFSWDKTDVPVVAVDGLFFAVRADLFAKVSFDEATFDGFHFYDIDLCMQVREHAECRVTRDILVKHLSGGSFDATWKMYAQRFIAKYAGRLPVSCVNSVPDPQKRIPFENFDLKGKAPQTTIA